MRTTYICSIVPVQNFNNALKVGTARRDKDDMKQTTDTIFGIVCCT